MSAVLFVSYAGLDGGAERLLVDAIEAVGPAAVLACPPGPLERRAAGIPVIRLPERRLEVRGSVRDRLGAPARLVAHALEIRSLVESLQPETVVAWSARAQIACAAALAGTQPRLVFQSNDLPRTPGIARLVRAAAARADLVLAPSHAVARPLQVPEARLRIIPPGVDLDVYRPIPNPNPRQALTLGAVVGWKRPDLALEAVAIAARSLPDLSLTIAGPVFDDRLFGALRRRADMPDLAGRVVFAGAVDDPSELIRESGCLLHCADCEPFGIALVEALASGVPVVAPDACGPAEIADHSCGRLYTPGDAAAAAAALRDVLVRRASLAAGARERAVERFDARRSREDFRTAIDPPTADPDAGADVSLVTVLHNSRSEVAALVASVERHLPRAELVIVDSGSDDGGPDWVRERVPEATVIELGRNAGFGAASNAGVEAATRPVTVMVNPDVELLDSSLERLARDRARGPERILAPLVLLPDGIRPDSAQPEPATPAALVTALVPPATLPPPLRTRVAPWRARRARRAGWAVGCCVAARTDTLRRLGPFDADAFLYAEDLELGLRASDAGVETWYRPDARVLHHAAHSSKRAFGDEPYELLASRRRAVVRRVRGPGRRRIDDAAQLFTFAQRWLLKTLLRRDATRERRQLKALLTAMRANADE